tara:strand:- start:562 stop:1191 length:630 start_codon:yes stop_codon:yes gene_type:complete
MAVSKTTKLDAINSMLIGIGEAPVNTLNSGLQEAEVAAILLDNVSREVQSACWSFNTDLRYTLTPNTAKEIVLPSNTLVIDTTKLKRDYNTDVIERKSRLYDRTKNSYEFDGDVEVDITYLFDFEELPEVARRYITLRAGRKFQENILGSSEMTQLQFKDEQAALINLRDFESQSADYNIFDNYDTYAAVDRGLSSPVNTLDTQRRLYS